MKKIVSYVVLLGILILGVIMVYPNIKTTENTTSEEKEQEIEVNKEVISKDNDTTESMDYTLKYTISDLNMRTSPSTEYETIQRIPLGEEVKVIAQENDWDQIIYKDQTGYVSSKYLIDSKEEVEDNVMSVFYEVENEETLEAINIIDGILLVNKTYGLPANYNPGENSVAVEKLHEMIQAAKEEIGKNMMSVSGFRTYEYQKGLYNNYVARDGKEKADKYSAQPGYSEHQTGLAFDIGGEEQKYWVNDSFADTAEAGWLSENAHKYGFILRYPKGKTDITGYKYEPWHFRYVGVEHATEIYENDLTLEEYLL